MYFPKGEEYTGIIEVEGFKFRKHVTRQDDYILIEITDMTYRVIAETKVYDVSDVDIAQEVINAAIYDFIEYQTDELDKVMAHFIKN
ncbi:MULTISPECIES: DUF1108 family protein [Staphylococcus intermedius group]|uniref:Putative phi PVL-like protein n=1 Tax=Staphylococcus intermedius NCTC 11048 TaxID=1141106 RepID=A0A380G815_STAIN|nr:MULTISPECIES: DUF1108 family protein [Staphylococcus intermedius group]HEC2213477.1 DUF1108 family protein [Staphylococcus delphini]ANQ82721.1 hypothetical protein A9I66_12115 [Staphylococcus pseudintermedius]EGQ3336131.1 DUF1108 family protein [Staphylococcus pseudintermedius]EGQ3344261.1 DUF1108 family protein [Staphylococcus pseudintermedius]EGQ3349097.1 DUF1108 family protein [Staphylococcus pseudintermedius]